MDFWGQLEQIEQRENKEKMQEQEISPIEAVKELEQLNATQDKEKRAKELQAEIYKKMINNIRESENIKININKSSFEDKDKIIDILLYAVGILSTDPIFYETNISKLKDHTPIYK